MLYARPEFFWYAGIQHYDVWFADTLALLASNDAVAQGLNPYAPNPLDFFGRPHVYSHWWLGLRHLGLTRADISWLGPLIVVAVVTLACWRLRPRNGWQFFQALLLLLSSPLLLALERANNDLIIFIILFPLAALLTSKHDALRWLAVALIATSAGLKYYPAAASLVLISPSLPGNRPARIAVGCVLLAVTAWSVAPDLAIFGPLAPQASGWLSFGAAAGLAELGIHGAAATIVVVGTFLVTVLLGWRASARADGSPAAQAAPTPQSLRAHLTFVVAAALLVGCFLTSANFAYRFIFAVGLVPWLWHAGAEITGRRRLARVTMGLLLLVLWQSTLFTWGLLACRGLLTRANIDDVVRYCFVAGQPATWILMGCLVFFLTDFVRGSLRRVSAA
jgi:hypothetical protein